MSAMQASSVPRSGGFSIRLRTVPRSLGCFVASPVPITTRPGIVALGHHAIGSFGGDGLGGTVGGAWREIRFLPIAIGD